MSNKDGKTNVPPEQDAPAREAREETDKAAASGWARSAEQAANGEARAQETANGGAAGEADAAALLAENAELKDKLLRAMADMDNLRKRLEREKEDAVKYAAAQFARDMLSVSDNLSRALEHVPEEKRAEGSEFFKNLIEGVEMTLKDLLATFERHGIKRINPMGEKFDPNYHQAMFEVTDTDAPTGTVVHVMQDAYTHHDRVLRPAMVGVAKREDKDKG